MGKKKKHVHKPKIKKVYVNCLVDIVQEEYVPMNLRDYSRRVIQRVIPSYILVPQEK